MARVLSKVTHLCLRIGSLQELTVPHLVSRSSTFYKPQSSNKAFKRPHLFSTLWATLIHHIPSISFSILFFHLRCGLPSGYFPSSYDTKIMYVFIFSIIHHIPSISFLILFFHLRCGLPSGFFPSDYATKIMYVFIFSRIHHIPSISFLILFFHLRCGLPS